MRCAGQTAQPARGSRLRVPSLHYRQSMRVSQTTRQHRPDHIVHHLSQKTTIEWPAARKRPLCEVRRLNGQAHLVVPAVVGTRCKNAHTPTRCRVAAAELCRGASYPACQARCCRGHRDTAARVQTSGLAPGAARVPLRAASSAIQGKHRRLGRAGRSLLRSAMGCHVNTAGHTLGD